MAHIFKIEIDAHTLEFIQNSLLDYLADLAVEGEPVITLAAIETQKRVKSSWDDLQLMRRSTVLAETPEIIVYENPDKGDEAPVMVWSKRYHALDTESPFYDASDLYEIQDWVVGTFGDWTSDAT